MDSVPGVDEGLYNFLGHQLLSFLSDEVAPTDNISINGASRPAHLTEKELDDLFLSAFDEFDGVDSQIGEACASKSISNGVEMVEPTSETSNATSNASHPSKATRKFAQPVSNKDIVKTMQSAIPQKTQRDSKYC